MSENISFKEIDNYLKNFDCNIERYYFGNYVHYYITFNDRKKTCQEFYNFIYSKVMIMKLEKGEMYFKKDFLDQEDESYIFDQFARHHDEYEISRLKEFVRTESKDKLTGFKEIEEYLKKEIIHEKYLCIDRIAYEDSADYILYIEKISKEKYHRILDQLSKRVENLHSEIKNASYEIECYISFSKKYCNSQDYQYVINKSSNEDTKYRHPLF